MNRRTIVGLKIVVWIACLLPLAWLIDAALTDKLGADQTAAIAFFTGLTTLRLLTLSLAITPLRRIVPRLAWLIRFRRLLGLFAFFYATLHLVTYIFLYANLDLNVMLTDVTRRRFIIAGMAAWLLLLPLALTSTHWAIRRLGGRNWNRLHRLVYIAVCCAVAHYWWQVKTGVLTPLPISLLLTAILLARPLLAWRENRRTAALAQ